MRFIRVLIILTLVVSLAGSLVGCATETGQVSPKQALQTQKEAPKEAPKTDIASEDQKAVAAKETKGGKVKIGLVYPLSGPAASTGESAKKGALFAAEEINKAGGIKALGGATLEMIPVDDQGKPDVAMSQTEYLINNENVVAIVGTALSATAIAASQVADRAGVPWLNDIAGAPEMTERGLANVFSIAAPIPVGVASDAGFIKYAAEKSGNKIKRLAFLYEDTEFGQGLSGGLKKVLQPQGFEVAADIVFTAGIKDPTPEIMKIKAANPDFVYVAANVADSIVIVRTMDRLNYRPLLQGGGNGFLDAEFLKSVGKAAEGAFTGDAWSKDLSVGKDVNERFKAKYGHDMDSHSPQAYQAVIVIAEALEKAGSAERSALREGLKKVDIPPGPRLVMPFDRVKFDEKGQNASVRIVTQIQDGQYVTVYPAKYATKELRLTR